MPRTEEQFKGMREEKKALIMRVALELFAADGYHGTTISSIARKAGISQGLLYNYFESKEDLIRTIIFSGLDIISGLLDPDNDGMITQQEMEHFLGRFFDLLKDDLFYWRLYFSLFVQSPVARLAEDRLTEFMDSYIDLLTSYFESRGCEDPRTEALLFGALLDGIGINYISNPSFFPLEKMKKMLLHKYT